jgi:hypothetical protein
MRGVRAEVQEEERRRLSEQASPSSPLIRHAPHDTFSHKGRRKNALKQ